MDSGYLNIKISLPSIEVSNPYSDPFVYETGCSYESMLAIICLLVLRLAEKCEGSIDEKWLCITESNKTTSGDNGSNQWPSQTLQRRACQPVVVSWFAWSALAKQCKLKSSVIHFSQEFFIRLPRPLESRGLSKGNICSRVKAFRKRFTNNGSSHQNIVWLNIPANPYGEIHL